MVNYNAAVKIYYLNIWHDNKSYDNMKRNQNIKSIRRWKTQFCFIHRNCVLSIISRTCVRNKKEMCRGSIKVLDLQTVLNSYLNFSYSFYLFSWDCITLKIKRGAKNELLRKISPQSKKNGRRKSQTQWSPLLIRRDYRCFCFLKLW